MAVDVERLIIRLEATQRQFERQLAGANRTADRRARQIERRFATMNRNISAGAHRLGMALGAAFAGAVTIRGAQELIDAATRIDNSLKVAGLSGEELARVYDRLFDSAIRNAAPLETLANLYGRAALVQNELKISTEELLNFTDRIALALRVSGQSAAESSGALLQLAQALGSGTVRAEEFNSILEGALPIAQAAAAGLEEAGGSVAKLRQLVIDGKVSSEAFFRAFEAGSPILEDKVANAVLTIDQRFTNLRTALIDAAKRFNNSTAAANTFGEAIDSVTDFVNGVDFEGLISEIQTVIEQFKQGIQWANNFAATIAEASGLENVGEFITGGRVSILGGGITSSKALRERINQGFEAGEYGRDADVEARLRELAGGAAAPKGGRVPASGKRFTPVSLADFDAPAGGGSGGSKSKRSREEDFAREVRQIQERTAAIQAETEAQAAINPLIDDYGFAIEKARATQELLNAAKKQGLAVTPELKEKIASLATAYASATVAAEQLQERQDMIRDAVDEFAEFGRDALGGFVTDLKNGVSAADALANALSRIGDRLLDMALDSLFSPKSGGGLLGMIFGGFRAGGGPVSGGRPYVVGERGPEIMVPNTSGRVLPNSALGKAGAQNVHVTVGVTTDGNGNLMPFVQSVAQNEANRSTATLARQVPKMVDARSNARQTRGVRA